MSLSRKHYQAIAAEIRAEQEEGYEASIDNLTERLISYFQSDNPNFRPDTFRKAAQP